MGDADKERDEFLEKVFAEHLPWITMDKETFNKKHGHLCDPDALQIGSPVWHGRHCGGARDNQPWMIGTVVRIKADAPKRIIVKWENGKTGRYRPKYVKTYFWDPWEVEVMPMEERHKP